MQALFKCQILSEPRFFSNDKYASVKVLAGDEVVNVNFKASDLPDLTLNEVVEISGRIQCYKGNLNVWA